jgi:hypothetical protein
MISLSKLIREMDQTDPTVPTAPVAPTSPSTSGGQPLPAGAIDYNINADFSDFETKIAKATEDSKAAFLRNLNSRVLGKKVSIQASKGYGQPIRDYQISVTSISLDYFYDRYVVIFKDEDDKEYFLKTGFKITILGQGEPLKPKKAKKPKALVPTRTPPGMPGVKPTGQNVIPQPTQ